MLPTLAVVLLSVLSASVDARPAVKGLAREDADARSARVSEVRYALSFSIDAETADFSGSAEVFFRLKDVASPLTIDFVEGKVLGVESEGRPAPFEYNGLFVTVPPSALREGENRLRVRFSHPYSKGGAGLYRSKDPIDGLSYAYTDFEPYDANQLFPCFDQPDLKASFALEVEAPLDWTVISSVRESEVLPAKNGRRRWSFPGSKLFSTYVFSLHAGPYAEWSSSAAGIPLRLFARRSLAPHVDAKEWFEFTRQGFAFFNEYFGVAYPYGKYDQIIVPDFVSGAMENVGAVTFSERFVQRSAPTREQRMDKAGVILHEMAHMWFGNLVTMRWWDDLWLNESFASYMAALAMAEATEFKESWVDFFLSDKLWAYREDQWVTTHPIEVPVPDTEQAFANFDGITYGKGASTLKQGAFALGAERFRDGVRRYLKKHSYANATRADFIGALGGSALDEWTKRWLQTEGLNAVWADWSCAGGKVTRLSLKQETAWGAPVLRPHATRVALYDEALKPLSERTVSYSAAETPVVGLVGKPCPALVLPNRGDHDYAKLRLDPVSLAAARARLSSVAGPLDRAQLWAALWEATRDGQLSLDEFARAVETHLPAESDDTVAVFVGRMVVASRFDTPSLFRYLIEAPKRLKAAERLERVFLARLEKAPAGGHGQQEWFDAYARLAATPEASARLRGWLDGEGLPEDFTLDADRRWALIEQLSRLAHRDADALIAGERRRDPSRRGQTAAIRAEAIRPDPAVKRLWIDKITGDGLGFEEQRAALRALFPPEQSPLRRAFSGEFFAKLPELSKTRQNAFIGEYSAGLVPTLCDPAGSTTIARFVAADAVLPPIALKRLKQAQQEDERCVRLQK